MAKNAVKTYTTKVVVEPDEDRWHAYCPDLREYGAATWGHTRQEALRHIHEVVELIIEELIENGEAGPGNLFEVGPQRLRSVCKSAWMDSASGCNPIC